MRAGFRITLTVGGLLLGMALALPVPSARSVEAGATALTADTAMVALGRRLFYEGDLSRDGSMACATCHGQHRGFAEGNRAHPGVTGEAGRRNVQGLANVGRRTHLTWANPILRDLEAQVLVPLMGEHPVEMGMKGMEAELARRLHGNACYVRLFTAAFPQEAGHIDTGTVARALAAFQRSLVSDDAPVDRFLRGDASALSPLALEGRQAFARACASCHAGQDFTDDRFHRVTRGAVDPRDRGLGEITGRSRDDGKFRTPSLRNVAVSAPYFHDGESPTLEDAIRRHRHVRASMSEQAALIAYMASFTDETFLTDSRFTFPAAQCELP